MRVSAPSEIIRFGVFEVDLHTQELRKQGFKIKLTGQPFEVLAMLLSRPGELVTREEFEKQLWSGDTFVDFEHGLNAAVKKLREALGDDANNPRFVETLQRRGYRFIAPVEALTPGPSPGGRVDIESDLQPSPAGRGWPRAAGAGEGPLRKYWVVAAGGAAVVIAAVLLILNVGGLRDKLMTAVGAGSARPGEGGALPYPKIDSLAVLPLENLSGDPEQDYFSDGMTDELITELGQVGSLRVISRTSTMRYKGAKKPLPEIARELNVQGIVEGSVLRSENWVRVSVKLIDAKSDRHLWSHSYESELRDVLQLQSRLARDITQQIQATLTPAEQSRLARPRPVNPEAHEVYLRGCFYLETWREFGEAGWKKALEYLEKAVSLDPTYAPAYARLALAYVEVGHPGILPPNEAYPKATAAALKALELDETLPEAHAALSLAKLSFEWDWEGAEREAKRAVELGPNNVHAIRSNATYLTVVGRGDEAIAAAKRTPELDPFGRPLLGWVYGNAGRLEDGVTHVRKEMERRNHPLLPYFLTNLYAFSGRCAEAMATADKYNIGASGAKAYGLCGRRAMALKYLRELELGSKRRYVDPVHFAWIYIGLGNKEQVLLWYEEGYRKHSTMMVYLKIDEVVGRASPTLKDNYYDDPRFQDLVRRMNFPP